VLVASRILGRVVDWRKQEWKSVSAWSRWKLLLLVLLTQVWEERVEFRE